MGGDLPPTPLHPRVSPFLLLLVLLRLAGRGAAKFNFQDLFPEEQSGCLGEPWPFPWQEPTQPVTLPDSAGRSTLSLEPEPEESRVLCVDTESIYLGSVSASGLHRTLCADYEGCSSRHWLHKVKKPLTLVTWGAALHMAKVELAQVVAWLQRYACKRHVRYPWRCWLLCGADRIQVLQRLLQCREDRTPRKLKAPASQGRARRDQPPPRPRPPRSRRHLGKGSRGSRPPPPPATAEDSPHPALPRNSSGRSLPAPHPGCQCPDRGEAHEPQAEKEVRGLQGGEGQRRHRLPTPRTEEAAWAASALTFLLVVLMLAVLYTRLHQNCHRGRSLYWAASGDEGQETVAAVLKRRLLQTQGRRKKRSRQQQKPLLPTTSGDSSE